MSSEEQAVIVAATAAVDINLLSISKKARPPSLFTSIFRVFGYNIGLQRNYDVIG